MTVKEEDKEKIINELNEEIDDLPGMIENFIPPLPEILEKIPESAEGYKVEELLDVLEEAWGEDKIDW